MVFNRVLIVLINAPYHRALGGSQVVMQCAQRIHIPAANQGGQNRHMLFQRDDVALLKIAFIPLIMRMKNH